MAELGILAVLLLVFTVSISLCHSLIQLTNEKIYLQSQGYQPQGLFAVKLSWYTWTLIFYFYFIFIFLNFIFHFILLFGSMKKHVTMVT